MSETGRLFELMERTDSAPRRHDEGSWSFYNRVAGSYWHEVRALCEAWFASMPESVRADVLSRFKSNDETQHRSAFWEMYLHAAFASLGYGVEAHPAVPGTGKRPDFKIHDAQPDFYVEATCCTPSGEDVADAARANVVYAALDRLKNGNFWLQVELNAQGDKPLPAKNLRYRLEMLLGGLDPDALQEALVTGHTSYAELPALHWEEDGWDIDVRALPKPPSARCDDRVRPVGVIGPTSGWCDDRGSLLRTLGSKSHRYGLLDAPYLVAVRLDGLTVDTQDICDGLFGQRVAVISEGADGALTAREFRQPDGLWSGPKGPRATRVSGVLFTKDLIPPLVCRKHTEPFLWLNPWAARPLPSLPWATTCVNLKTGHLVVRDSDVALHQLFRLPEGWPGKDDERFGAQ